MQNRGSRSPAALAHGGVSWRLSELARARGELGWCQGEAAWGSSSWGRCGASRARRVAGQVVAPVYGPAIGRVQGGERLKKLSVAVL